MNYQSTAIILFAFNRPDKLQRLADSLALCPEFGEFPLYIFIDGARTPDELISVEATASVANNISHPYKTVFCRERNLGLKQALREGISMILARHNAVIVLEDDLIVGPHALDFLMKGLTQYRDDRRVASICAYALNDETSGEEDASPPYFLPMTHPWGWATWDDRWQAHLETLVLVPEQKSLRSRTFKRAMNVSGMRNFAQMLKLAERGVINSWWIYWHREAIFRQQVSLFPARTHIINAGIDGSGTHASRWNILRSRLPQKTLAQKKVALPEKVFIDFFALDQIIASREARYNRIIGTLGLIKRYMKATLGR